VDPEIVLVGDSITHFFGSLPPQPAAQLANGPETFASLFAGRRVLNAGFGWDRTQNVLWRLAHGELDGLSPSLVVVHIGTNNTSATANAPANTASEIAEGIAAVCSALRDKLGNDCRLVVMKIFPREHSPTAPRRVLIDAANTLLPNALKDAGITTSVDLLDVRPAMLEPDGTFPQSLARDFCHPTERGYSHWADVLRPFVDSAPTRPPANEMSAADATTARKPLLAHAKAGIDSSRL
jgi:lysophospholipase L1-like esterase